MEHLDKIQSELLDKIQQLRTRKAALESEVVERVYDSLACDQVSWAAISFLQSTRVAQMKEERPIRSGESKGKSLRNQPPTIRSR